MFRTTSRTERAARQAQEAAARAQAASLKAQAAALKERVAPTTQHAKESATHAAEVAREWATPRFEKARDRGVERAAPRVEHAAEVLAPKVDAARDKIVEDVLPRIVDAINAAAAAAAAKADEAHAVTRGGLTAAEARAKAARKAVQPKRRKRKVLLVLSLIGAAIGAGYTAWKRSQPTEDPWVTATGTATPPSSRLSGGAGTGTSTVGTTGTATAGSSGAATLGAGSLAAESTDVDTPVPDGLASGTEQLAGGGEVGSDRVNEAEGTTDTDKKEGGKHKG